MTARNDSISEFKKLDADVRATVSQYREKRFRFHIVNALKLPNEKQAK